MTTEKTRPNIVLVITDQQRFDTIAAQGHPHMVTPNLDRLVREGVSFSRMFVTAPSCAPSRASLFTGLYPHQTGVLRNEQPWRWSWVESLAEAGYRCVNVGKMHTYPWEHPFGFHERHVVENKDRAHVNVPYFLDNWDMALYARGFEKPSRKTWARRADYRERLGAFAWELPADLHPDNFVGDLACHWLDIYPGREPFFLEIGLPGPHPPYDPTEDALALYEDRDLPEPIFERADIDAQPQVLKDLRREHTEDDHDAVVHLFDPTPEQMRRQRQHYFANVTMIDAQVGASTTTATVRSGPCTSRAFACPPWCGAVISSPVRSTPSAPGWTSAPRSWRWRASCRRTGCRRARSCRCWRAAARGAPASSPSTRAT